MTYFKLNITFADKSTKRYLFIRDSFSLADFIFKFLPYGATAKGKPEQLSEKQFEIALHSKKYEILNDFQNEKI